MSNTSIQLKKSGVTGNTPLGLAFGEVAINYADGKLYYKNYLGGTSYISNQSSFDTINANNSLILATGVSDTLSFVAGNNISITTNTTTKTIEISATSGGSTSGDTYANGAFIQANAAYAHANAAFNAANTGGSSTDSVARNTANAAFIQANSAYNLANTLIGGNASFINSGTSNVFFSSANGNILANVNGNTIVTITANGIVTAGESGDISGANVIYANTFVGTNAAIIAGINVVPYIQNAYTQANTATTNAATADSKAVSAGDYANSAFAVANTDVTNVSVTPGTYGGTTEIPVVTIAANGRITSVTNAAITTATGSFINSGTSNVFFSSANGSIIANVAGNTIFSITANGIVTAGANGDISGANVIYANTFIGTNAAIIAGINVVPYIQSVFTQANTATTNAATADSKAVSAGDYANSAFAVANTDVTNVSVTPGTYGGTTAIPVVTVSANGRVTAVTNAAITATATGSFINSGTSNVFFSSANGSIIANVAGNTIFSITANGIVTAGESGDISGANVIYANTFVGTNAAIIAGINVVPYIQSVFTQANSAYDSQNTTGSYANSAFAVANTDVTNVSVTPGTYGGTTEIPVVTIAANGRITSVTNAAITATATGSFINSGTSNVFFSSANGNILANVNGNTIVTITANGIVTAGANGDISGANGIYANTLYVQNANVTNTVFANSITFNDGTKLISANGIVASTAANAVTANVAVNARITNVTTGTYFPIVTDTTITGADTFHYSNNDFLMYAANNTFRATGNVWAGQFIAVGSNIPVVNATGHWVGRPLVANNSSTANVSNVAINARITVVNTGIYYPIVTDTTVTGSDTLHYSSNDFVMFASNNTFRATGNVWAGQFIVVGSNIPVVNATGHWIGQNIPAISSGTSNVSFSSANGNILANVGGNTIVSISNTGISLTGGEGNISGIDIVYANRYVANVDTIIAGINVMPYLQSSFAQANSVYLPSVTRLNVTNSGTSAYLISSYTGNNPTIYVTAGETIAFNLNVSGHPFMIRVSNGGANYNSGLTHVSANGTVTTDSAAQGQISGTLYWSVPFDLAGNNYVYQCSVHSGMVGTISIGQPNAILLSTTNSAFIQANAAFIQANAAFAAANAGGAGTDQLARDTANASFIQANAAFAAANAGGAGTDQLARDIANAAFLQANAAFNTANTGGGGGGSGSSVISVNTFTGDGSQNSFTLSNSTTANNIIVNIDGVFQLKSAYTVSSNIITFTGTPANNSIIEVTTLVGTNLSYFNRTYTGDNTTVSFAVTSGVTNASIIVTENGIIQEPGVDYYISGANVVFTTPPSSTVKVGIRELASTANTGSAADASLYANGAFIQANAAYNQANTDFTNITIASPGTYGNATFVPVITVEANGRINTVSTIAITGGGGGSDPAAGNTANAAYAHANAAFNAANTVTSNNGATLSGTIVPLANTSDQFNIIGVTGNITIAAPAEPYFEGQKLIIRIKDAGTSVNISWNVIYRSIGTNLPTTTNPNKTAYIGFIYNTADADWDAVAISLEA